MSTAELEPELVLDCRGMLCPRPIIELGRRIGEVSPGGTVAVLADDPAAAADVPAWCRMRGQEYLGADTRGGVPAYLVRRVS
ncbi:MAG TPA: sulfurtransferase TusA family protein [Marmoricola sp.]|nr:sulfurtransferase TusA family protein [Marmoricola sp.]